jgi:hypothetical protein
MTAGVCDNAVNRTQSCIQLYHPKLSLIFYESGLLCVKCEKQVIKLLLELALEIVLPPFMASENATSSDILENESSSFLLMTPSGSFLPAKESVYNAGAVRVLIRSLLLFTPKVQLEVLSPIERLVHASFNQETLTSVSAK